MASHWGSGKCGQVLLGAIRLRVWHAAIVHCTCAGVGDGRVVSWAVSPPYGKPLAGDRGDVGSYYLCGMQAASRLVWGCVMFVQVC
jgi:hypothetical protein